MPDDREVIDLCDSSDESAPPCREVIEIDDSESETEDQAQNDINPNNGNSLLSPLDGQRPALQQKLPSDSTAKSEVNDTGETQQRKPFRGNGEFDRRPAKLRSLSDDSISPDSDSSIFISNNRKRRRNSQTAERRETPIAQNNDIGFESSDDEMTLKTIRKRASTPTLSSLETNPSKRSSNEADNDAEPRTQHSRECSESKFGCPQSSIKEQASAQPIAVDDRPPRPKSAKLKNKQQGGPTADEKFRRSAEGPRYKKGHQASCPLSANYKGHKSASTSNQPTDVVQPSTMSSKRLSDADIDHPEPSQPESPPSCNEPEVDDSAPPPASTSHSDEIGSRQSLPQEASIRKSSAIRRDDCAQSGTLASTKASEAGPGSTESSSDEGRSPAVSWYSTDCTQAFTPPSQLLADTEIRLTKPSSKIESSTFKNTPESISKEAQSGAKPSSEYSSAETMSTQQEKRSIAAPMISSEAGSPVVVGDKVIKSPLHPLRAMTLSQLWPVLSREDQVVLRDNRINNPLKLLKCSIDTSKKYPPSVAKIIKRLNEFINAESTVDRLGRAEVSSKGRNAENDVIRCITSSEPLYEIASKRNSKYSLDGRVDAQGNVRPPSTPVKKKDGTFRQPRGRPRLDMKWDAAQGQWVKPDKRKRKRPDQNSKDPHLVPKSKLIQEPDGTFRRPRGPTPQGFSWDSSQGLWTPRAQDIQSFSSMPAEDHRNGQTNPHRDSKENEPFQSALIRSKEAKQSVVTDRLKQAGSTDKCTSILKHRAVRNGDICLVNSKPEFSNRRSSEMQETTEALGTSTQPREESTCTAFVFNTKGRSKDIPGGRNSHLDACQIKKTDHGESDKGKIKRTVDVIGRHPQTVELPMTIDLTTPDIKENGRAGLSEAPIRSSTASNLERTDACLPSNEETRKPATFDNTLYRDDAPVTSASLQSKRTESDSLRSDQRENTAQHAGRFLQATEPNLKERKSKQASLSVSTQEYTLSESSGNESTGTDSEFPSDCSSSDDLDQNVEEESSREEIHSTVRTDDLHTRFSPKDFRRRSTRKRKETSLYSATTDAQPRRNSKAKATRVGEKKRSFELDDLPVEEMPPVLEELAHLCKTTHVNGLPEHRITVFDVHETLYDFILNVGTSGIPNSGQGCFLTYKGARVLNPDSQERARKRMLRREPIESETMAPLTAVSPEGFGIAVKLTGSNLHGNHNCPYWPETKLPLSALYPSGKSVQVKLSGENLHYDSDEDECPPFKSKLFTPIGHLKMHVESDYVESSLPFSTRTVGGLVDLGRYGPILKNDRKLKLHYDMKNFIFNFEPSNWNFGVSDKIRGEEQMIDITGDDSGEPHLLARRQNMMYVNEVGHNDELEQNVIALEKNEHAVHYYLDAKRPLQKGETVELLVDYLAEYEKSRERKGYGQKNVAEGVRSDDHEATRVQRNFHEREQVEEIAASLTFMEMYQLIEFLHSKILKPVSGKIEHFCALLKARPTDDCDPDTPNKDRNSLAPSILQWIARRRMNWISRVLCRRLHELEQMPAPTEGFPYAGIFDLCKSQLESMKWREFERVMRLLDGAHTDAGKTARSTLRAEMNEEILFQVRDKVASALDESTWTPIAVALTKSLCECAWGGTELVEEDVLRLARSSADDIKVACKSRNSQVLAFDSGVLRKICIERTFSENFESLNGWSPFFPENSTIPKGILFALEEIQNQTGAGSKCFDVPVQDCFVMGRRSQESNSIPFKVSQEPANVDENWYLLWQVVYIVFAFTDTFWSNVGPEPNVTFLQRLCNAVGVEVQDAQRVVNAGIASDFQLPQLFPKGKQSPTTPRAKRTKMQSVSSPSQRIKPKLFKEIVFAALTELGWRIATGTRESDLYFLPPGVERARGFRSRVDYFDSSLQVMDFIQTDGRWKENESVLGALERYDSCSKLIEKLKLAKRLPKKVTVDWLLKELEQKNAA